MIQGEILCLRAVYDVFFCTARLLNIFVFLLYRMMTKDDMKNMFCTEVLVAAFANERSC